MVLALGGPPVKWKGNPCLAHRTRASPVRLGTGVTTAIMLDGEPHLVSDAANLDIRTWETLFFNAWLKDDAAARKTLESATSVRGGVPDHRTLQQVGNRR